MAKITVQLNMDRRLYSFHNYLWIDGKKTGKIANGETQSFDLEEGDHVIQMRFGIFKLSSSRKFIFSLSGEEEKFVLAHSRKSAYRPVMILSIFFGFVLSAVIFKDSLNIFTTVSETTKYVYGILIVILYLILINLLSTELIFKIEEMNRL